MMVFPLPEDIVRISCIYTYSAIVDGQSPAKQLRCSRLKLLSFAGYVNHIPNWIILVLLMEEILHQLIGSLSYYLLCFIHPRWLFGISSINSINLGEGFCPSTIQLTSVYESFGLRKSTFEHQYWIASKTDLLQSFAYTKPKV